MRDARGDYRSAGYAIARRRDYWIGMAGKMVPRDVAEIFV